MAEVALVSCREYSLRTVKDNILEAAGLIGFDPACFRGARVALKPNLLSAVQPDSGVVTHPVFFRAVAEIVLDHGGKAVLIESPAVASLENAMRAAGYDPMVRELGIAVADIREVRRIACRSPKLFTYFDIAAAFFETDVIVNIPKFKTHNLTYITAAVKNLFGAVPGMRKAQMHMRFPGREEFSEMILDLYGAFLTGFEPPKRILHVLDAVVALEGEGPGSSGSPRHAGAIIVGEDALAVDYVAVQIAGLDSRLAPTVNSGFAREFGVASPDDIAVKGETIEAMRLKGFVPPRSPGMTAFLKRDLPRRIMKRLFVERPVPKEPSCTLCYQCRQICPAEAISPAGAGRKVPVFDYGRCIRCFCCQEVCPEGAITIRKAPMQWLLRCV